MEESRRKGFCFHRQGWVEGACLWWHLLPRPGWTVLSIWNHRREKQLCSNRLEGKGSECSWVWQPIGARVLANGERALWWSYPVGVYARWCCSTHSKDKHEPSKAEEGVNTRLATQQSGPEPHWECMGLGVARTGCHDSQELWCIQAGTSSKMDRSRDEHDLKAHCWHGQEAGGGSGG